MKLRLPSISVLILLALSAAFAGCGGGDKNNSGGKDGSSNAAPAAASAAATSTAPQGGTAAAAAQTPSSALAVAGKTVAAGDLDLTVAAVRYVNTKAFDRTNSADVAVDIQILDSRGDTATFSSAFDVKLVDDKGAAHEPDPFCMKCPDDLQEANLNKGEQAKGTIYFALRGAAPKELDYHHFSDPKVVLPLPAVQGKPVQAAATADPKSPDCQYATKVDSAFLAFLGGVFSLLDLAPSSTPGAGGASALTPDLAKKASDNLLKAATAADTALKGVTPPADFKAYHAEVVKQFDAIVQQLQDAQKAVAAGDLSKLEALLNGGSAFDDPSQALEAKFPDLAARLNACPSPLGDINNKP